MLAALLGRVIAGDGGMAILAATVTVAPLVALLAAPTAPGPATRAPGVPDVAVLVASLLILVANLIVLGDLAHAMGVARAYGIGAGALLAALVMLGQRADREWRLAAALGACVLILPLGFVIGSVGAPWTVWSTIASRPALTFDGGSPWVTRGHTFGEDTRLTFHEPHRVVAASPATWRVIERDAPRGVVREWQLGMGDVLTLRPGDELALEAGARVRFEAGRRIPGSPVSGIAWGDGRTGPTRLTPLATVALVVTIVAGALGLGCSRAQPTSPAGDGGRRASLTLAWAPFLVLLVIGGAILWGLYGVALAPEIALAPAGVVGLVEVMTRLLPEWQLLFETGVLAGIALLFVGSLVAWQSGPAMTLRALCASMRSAQSPVMLATVTATIVALAAMLALHGTDSWRWFVGALGLAASASAAPRLAMAGRRGEIVGGLVGGTVFAIAVVAPDTIPEALRPFSTQPALVAAPLGWAAARLARARGRATHARAGARAKGAVRA